MAAGDLTCKRMSRLFDKLVNVPTPIADAYKVETTGKPKDEWWRTEQEHMVGWFRENATTGWGAYSRETPNNSAKRCYNRLLSHEGLLWVAEAVGVDAATVQAAADAADSVGDFRGKCRAIRQVIPWETVYTHALPLVQRYRIR